MLWTIFFLFSAIFFYDTQTTIYASVIFRDIQMWNWNNIGIKSRLPFIENFTAWIFFLLVYFFPQQLSAKVSKFVRRLFEPFETRRRYSFFYLCFIFIWLVEIDVSTFQQFVVLSFISLLGPYVPKKPFKDSFSISKSNFERTWKERKVFRVTKLLLVCRIYMLEGGRRRKK